MSSIRRLTEGGARAAGTEFAEGATTLLRASVCTTAAQLCRAARHRGTTQTLEHICQCHPLWKHHLPANDAWQQQASTTATRTINNSHSTISLTTTATEDVPVTVTFHNAIRSYSNRSSKWICPQLVIARRGEFLLSCAAARSLALCLLLALGAALSLGACLHQLPL